MAPKLLTDGHDFFDAAVLFLDQQWRAVVPPKALWLRRDREERERERKRMLETLQQGDNTFRFITLSDRCSQTVLMFAALVVQQVV